MNKIDLTTCKYSVEKRNSFLIDVFYLKKTMFLSIKNKNMLFFAKSVF